MIAFKEGKRVEIPKLKDGEYPRILHNCVLVWDKHSRFASVYIKSGNSWKKIISNAKPYFFGKEVCDDQDLFIAFKTENGLKKLLNCKTGKIIFEGEFKTEQLLARVSIKNDPNQTIFILQSTENDQFTMIDADGKILLDETIMREIKWIHISNTEIGGMTFISFGKKGAKQGNGYFVFFDRNIRLVAFSEDQIIDMEYRAIEDKDGRLYYPVFHTEGKDRKYFDLNGKEIFPTPVSVY